MASMPKDLNDPFECLLSLESLYSNDDLNNYCKRKKEIIEKQKSSKDVSKKKLYKKFNYNIKRIRLDEKFRENKKNNRLNEFIEEINKSIRITSFSKNKDSLLMWAHYADEHRGFVVGINPKGERKTQIYDVTYCEDLIKLQHDSNGNLNVKEEALSTKSKEWSYENEVRLLSIPRDPNKADFVKFEPNEISEIIFGARMQESEKNRVIEHCRNNTNLHHIKIFQSKISKTQYKLDFEEIGVTSW